MFEKREVRFVAGVSRDDLWAKAWDWWTRQGFALTKTRPYRCHGASFYARIGLRREFDLILDEANGGCNVDLTFRAVLTQEGLIAGAVAAVVLWPIAVLGGAVSYSEYEADARNLLLAFWQFVTANAGERSTSQPPPMPPPCKGCGSGLLPDWKVCPYCGRAKDAEG
jgi:hypothetical protein